MAIGFKRSNEQEGIEKKEKNLIAEVDKEYAQVLDSLDALQNHISREHVIEEHLRNELTHIHTELQAIEQVFQKRTNLNHIVAASGHNDPQKAVSEIDELFTLDQEIVKRAETVERELHKFFIPEVKQEAEFENLDTKTVKHLRIVSQTMMNKLHFLSEQARRQVSNYQEFYGQWKKNVISQSSQGIMGFHR